MVPINDCHNEPFDLQHLVWQGCPIASYIFLLIADILAYTLQNMIYQMQRLIFMDGQQSFSHMFVDDTVLFLHGDLFNLQQAKVVLDKYCKGVGAFLNMDKFHAF